MNRYLRTVWAAPPLGRDEELALVERWQNGGDLAARHALLGAHLRSVAAIAYKYRRYGVPLDELIAEGNLALVRALSKFDPRRGTRFMTYASFWVRAYILDHVLGSFSMVGGRSGAFRSKVFFKLRRERARLLSLVGDGEQADALLAQSLGLGVEAVRGMVRRLETRDESIENGPGQSPTPWLERLKSDEPNGEEQLAKRELAGWLHDTLERAMTRLNERERYIAHARLLADEEHPPSLAEIGRRLGVSRERARQLETRIKQKLRPALESHAREAGLSRGACNSERVH
jgi:RNA polymerase sigma-32 factor